MHSDVVMFNYFVPVPVLLLHRRTRARREPRNQGALQHPDTTALLVRRSMSSGLLPGNLALFDTANLWGKLAGEDPL